LGADVNHLYRLGSDLLRTNNFDQASYGAGGVGAGAAGSFGAA